MVDRRNEQNGFKLTDPSARPRRRVNGQNEFNNTPVDPQSAFNMALRESWEADSHIGLSFDERLQRDRLRRQAGEDLLRDIQRKRNESNPPPAYSPRVRTPAYAPPLPPRRTVNRMNGNNNNNNIPPPLPPRRYIPRVIN
ncbi:hypothetical protein E3Q22_03473 [Wallemia mellicola]|uniref:Uncharacterized protein n=2 Tax=Wallemia mellicola TaxID=1708541 RepID=A0A4T0R0S8_9BASI|nr:hypothetical protein E3Q24_03207 [Wallemia mellicola]TIB76557.1 hypothetical protein E3Q22_03473 [Wallemia mellicola]TIB82627.1 hypothetical protein E3Q21_03300 [Wallemia mellicola]TIB85320.1 hypothetical protein E3Q20_03295 [Wallemia mellicola]TIB88413.1 hypothetical protein E3Q19_03348 [Wallemia mellicola]